MPFIPSRTWSSCSRRRANGSSTRTTPSTSPTTRSARSTATSSSSAASTPRRSRCSARANSGCGRRCSARRPRRSAPAARSSRRTWPSRPTASTASRGASDVDPLTLLGLFRGTNLGGWDPNEHNFNLYTIVIGAQTLHATGYAMGVVRDGAVGTGDPERDTAVLAFFGDGASSQGDVNEAFVWAGAGNLPVVFFCQNNQWAISEPVERQSRVPLYQRASGFGFPGVRVDGNDVLGLPRRHPQGPRRRAQRAGADADRGVHLPDEPAHDQRRPAPLPARQRGRDVEAQGPDRAGARLPDPRGARSAPDFFDDDRGRGEEARRAHPQGLPRAARPDAGVAVRPRPRDRCPTSLRAQRDEFVEFVAEVSA